MEDRTRKIIETLNTCCVNECAECEHQAYHDCIDTLMGNAVKELTRLSEELDAERRINIQLTQELAGMGRVDQKRDRIRVRDIVELFDRDFEVGEPLRKDWFFRLSFDGTCTNGLCANHPVIRKFADAKIDELKFDGFNSGITIVIAKEDW